eukprot:4572845-Prorocentrum_lima.AAC.1
MCIRDRVRGQELAGSTLGSSPKGGEDALSGPMDDGQPAKNVAVSVPRTTTKAAQQCGGDPPTGSSATTEWLKPRTCGPVFFEGPFSSGRL